MVQCLTNLDLSKEMPENHLSWEYTSFETDLLKYIILVLNLGEWEREKLHASLIQDLLALLEV